MTMTKSILAGASIVLLLNSCFTSYPDPGYGPPPGSTYAPPVSPGYAPPYSSPAPTDTPPAPGAPVRQDYPVAEKTGNPNRVISPYGPNYNVIDVSGFRSGQLARDPSNNKIFRVP